LYHPSHLTTGVCPDLPSADTEDFTPRFKQLSKSFMGPGESHVNKLRKTVLIVASQSCHWLKECFPILLCAVKHTSLTLRLKLDHLFCNERHSHSRTTNSDQQLSIFQTKFTQTTSVFSLLHETRLEYTGRTFPLLSSSM